MKRTTEEIEALVFNALGVGKERALSRADLVVITQSNDRQVRAAIEALRHDKAILTLPGGNGYYICHRTRKKAVQRPPDGLYSRINVSEVSEKPREGQESLREMRSQRNRINRLRGS